MPVADGLGSGVEVGNADFVRDGGGELAGMGVAGTQPATQETLAAINRVGQRPVALTTRTARSDP